MTRRGQAPLDDLPMLLEVPPLLNLIGYAYFAAATVVGPLATWKNRNLFRFGSHRLARAVAHTIVIGLLWWLLGPLALAGKR